MLLQVYLYKVLFFPGGVFKKISISFLIFFSILLLPRYILNIYNFYIFLPLLSGIGAILTYTLIKFINGDNVSSNNIIYIFIKAIAISIIILYALVYIKNNTDYRAYIFNMESYIINLGLGLSIFGSLDLNINFKQYMGVDPDISITNHVIKEYDPLKNNLSIAMIKNKQDWQGKDPSYNPLLEPKDPGDIIGLREDIKENASELERSAKLLDTSRENMREIESFLEKVKSAGVMSALIEHPTIRRANLLAVIRDQASQEEYNKANKDAGDSVKLANAANKCWRNLFVTARNIVQEEKKYLADAIPEYSRRGGNKKDLNLTDYTASILREDAKPQNLQKGEPTKYIRDIG